MLELVNTQYALVENGNLSERTPTPVLHGGNCENVIQEK